MTDVQQVLSDAVVAAIVAEFGNEYADADPVVRPSVHADYQANAALALAKRVGSPPREIAAKIAKHLGEHPACSSCEVSGPGFLNITVDQEWLTAAVQDFGTNGLHGVPQASRPETIVIDYSSPNVAKEMHIGHLRSTVIGDSLRRINAALGHTVIGQNHLGDWGTPFGMLIEYLLKVGEEEAKNRLAGGELTAFYQDARAEYNADEEFAERARQRVVTLQGGDAESLRLWTILVDVSKQYFMRVYDQLGVLLTEEDFAAESFYNPMLAEVVEEFVSAGIAETSDGAVCVFDSAITGKDDEPVPLILRKSDGGYGYGSTDAACVKYRRETLHADRILYVVGAPQAQHFQQIFRATHRMGWLENVDSAQHIPFGSVLGKDRKMFRTRAGESVQLLDVLTEAVRRAKVLLADRPGLDAAEIESIARAVGVGAMKYADLSNSREKDYVFDWDRMLSFEGDTGPYLQYAVARIHSLLAKAEVRMAEAVALPAAVQEPQEKELALMLLGFGRQVQVAAAASEPHKLCTYLMGLASAFTAFYEACPVVKADDVAVRDSRLKLSALTGQTLAYGLSLLGIESPRRM